ncbi:MAG: hypothetical protein EPN48_05065 [Microbacteriaceae bacterium]|nr:MAG: hypothetical protein EPN48_05065 [Microbacteriaceae bacterium]
MMKYLWAASVFALSALVGVAVLSVFALTHPWGLTSINDQRTWEIMLMSVAPVWIEALLVAGLGAALSVVFVLAVRWERRTP